MNTNPNDMAFPVTNPVDAPPNRHASIQLGLTKREYFAALAMQGILSSKRINDSYARPYSQCAIHFADALIAELSKVQS